jgi:hypothetical protein
VVSAHVNCQLGQRRSPTLGIIMPFSVRTIIANTARTHMSPDLSSARRPGETEVVTLAIAEAISSPEYVICSAKFSLSVEKLSEPGPATKLLWLANLSP